MGKREFTDDAICPCGSGRSYGNCCSQQSFKWMLDDDGRIFRELPLSSDMIKLFEQQRAAFIQQFGREPGPNDPVFFDLPSDNEYEHGFASFMARQGIDSVYIHAFTQTGLPLTPDNIDFIPIKDIEDSATALSQAKDLFPHFPQGLTVHNLTIKSLQQTDPRIKAKGFKQRLRKLLEKEDSIYALAFLNSRFREIPDAYLIDQESNSIFLFEVEDTHPLEGEKLTKYLNLWSLIAQETEWVLRIFILDRYGNSIELDCAFLLQGLANKDKLLP